MVVRVLGQVTSLLVAMQLKERVSKGPSINGVGKLG